MSAEHAVEALGAVIRDAIKRRTIQPLFPGGPGGLGATEYDIARDVLAAGYTPPDEGDDEPTREQRIEAAEDRAEQAAFDTARERS